MRRAAAQSRAASQREQRFALAELELPKVPARGLRIVGSLEAQCRRLRRWKVMLPEPTGDAGADGLEIGLLERPQLDEAPRLRLGGSASSAATSPAEKYRRAMASGTARPSSRRPRRCRAGATASATSPRVCAMLKCSPAASNGGASDGRPSDAAANRHSRGATPGSVRRQHLALQSARVELQPAAAGSEMHALPRSARPATASRESPARRAGSSNSASNASHTWTALSSSDLPQARNAASSSRCPACRGIRAR